ncbi:MAG: hypothetical protein MUF66_09975 [Gammaproteobacteria bacterium]|jgi:hypothetical protein|nr:hypothetical protein [Gammaproteobacteria bacterium]
MSANRSPLPRLPWLLALLALTGTGEAGAEAKLTERFDAGAWTGSAFVDAGTSRLSHCTVHTQYEGGQALVFVRSDEGFSMAVADPAWELPAGSRPSVLVGVDDRWSRQLTADAMSERVLRMDLGFDGKAVESFRQGETLMVAAEKAAARLSLAGTSQAILDLERCYLRHTRLAARPDATPVQPASLKPPRARAQDYGWGLRARMTLGEFKVLLRAAAGSDGESGVPDGVLGFASYFFLVPDRTLSLYWEIEARRADVDTLLRRQMESWREQCEGPAEVGEVPPDPQARGALRSGHVVCRDPGGAGYATIAVLQHGQVARVLLTVAGSADREAADAVNRRFAELLMEREARNGSF